MSSVWSSTEEFIDQVQANHVPLGISLTEKNFCNMSKVDQKRTLNDENFIITQELNRLLSLIQLTCSSFKARIARLKWKFQECISDSKDIDYLLENNYCLRQFYDGGFCDCTLIANHEDSKLPCVDDAEDQICAKLYEHEKDVQRAEDALTADWLLSDTNDLVQQALNDADQVL